MVATRRMFLIVSAVVSLVAAPLAAQAQGIFKCVDGELIAYQSMPCSNGQVEMSLASAQTNQAEPTRPEPDSVSGFNHAPLSAAPSPSPQGRSSTWPWRRTLTLGMADDEVLNLSGWGIPTRIIRTRTAREWREEWVYARTPGEERRLRFANATLVDIVDGSPIEMIASLSEASRK